MNTAPKTEDDSMLKWFNKIGRVLTYLALLLGVMNIVNQIYKIFY